MILAILAGRASWLESIKIYNAVILVFLSLSGVRYLQANVHKYENGVASSVIWTPPTIVMKPNNKDGLEPQDRVDKIVWALTRHLTRWKPRLWRIETPHQENLRIPQQSAQFS